VVQQNWPEATAKSGPSLACQRKTEAAPAAPGIAYAFGALVVSMAKFSAKFLAKFSAMSLATSRTRL